jgi:hypothetical protein
LERSFHRPTGLSDQSRLQLHWRTTLRGRLTLNGESLGNVDEDESQFDITQHVLTRNRICLEVVIDDTSTIGQPTCDVRLAIFA